MKQAIMTIAVLGVLLPISTAMAQQQMQTFTDASGSFTVDYPLGWKIIQPPDDSQGVIGDIYQSVWRGRKP